MRKESLRGPTDPTRSTSRRTSTNRMPCDGATRFMNFEVEQKHRVDDPDALIQTLATRGAALGPAIEQADTYFAHPSRDFAKTDEALRIRMVAGDGVVTFKGPKLDATTKTRREIELPI